MKFSTVTLFATGALAAISTRDVSTITDAINAISKATTALNTGITNFSPSDVSSLQSLAEAVESAITSGNAAVEPIPDISDSDALTLPSLIQSLSSDVTDAVNNAISHKSAFVSANAGGLVYSALKQIQSDTNTFSTTVISKVPTALDSIAQGLVAPITAALAKGVAAFQDQAGASTSSAGSSSSSSSPATASSSSSAVGSTVTSAPAYPTASATATSYSVGTSSILTSTVTAPTNATMSLTPYNPNAAAPTAAAGYAVALLVGLGVVAAI